MSQVFFGERDVKMLYITMEIFVQYIRNIGGQYRIYLYEKDGG